MVAERLPDIMELALIPRLSPMELHLGLSRWIGCEAGKSLLGDAGLQTI